MLKERWVNFGRESYANMVKFARFYGLTTILKATSQESLTKLWHETISCKLLGRLENQTDVEFFGEEFE